MAFSDDDDDSPSNVPLAVANYQFLDGNQEPVSFEILPLDPAPPTTSLEVFLHGASDGGLQKVFKPVTAWKLDLEPDRAHISVLSKDGKWIALEKARKIYEEKTARSIMVTVYALHFLRKYPEASEKTLWGHLNKCFSFEDKPTEEDLKNHRGLIQTVMERDQKLAKCPLLPLFLEERSTERASEDVQSDPTSKNMFIADDNETDDMMGAIDDDEFEDEPDLFDSVCAICDNGGELLCCEGRCMRSFHATKSAGEDSDCKSLGYTKSQVEALQNFLCRNCKFQKHQCFACGRLGSSDKSNGAIPEVFICLNATCGHFYHPKCVSRMLYRGKEAEAAECQRNIEAGGRFTCPLHKCVVCDKGENKEEVDMQFAMCRRCPKSYHRKCLPRGIGFDDIEEEDIVQRAWDDLLPNRILIYCLEHEMDEELGTPIRTHIKFPEIPGERKPPLHTQKSKVKVLLKNKRQDNDISPMRNRFGSQPVKRKSQDYGDLHEDHSFSKPKNVIQKVSGAEGGDKTIIRQAPDSNKKTRLLKDGAKLDLAKADGTVMLDHKGVLKEKKPSTSGVPSKSSFPDISDETEKRMKELMEQTSSSITLEGILKKRTVPSTHAYSGRNIDKSITLGKVEGAVEAVRAAIKKLEDGGSLEDAKAVCEPEVLRQLVIWSSKLRVYLSPFLHGVRYSSFGRHFTQVDKLKEIVDKLQCYVQNGDTIVDFCCGANDFSLLMKEKLETTGKKCSFKNFDIIQAKNDFCFEKKDWMTVQPRDLPTGSQLIMGLNPPFGVKASLANKFIDKALSFRPKLIILIVPPETERLDEKRTRYDLIWEDRLKLAGKSFYLPGSVDVNDKQIEQWNNTPPPLYLWSRTDWTAKHKAIALKQGHIENPEINEAPSDYATLKMEIDAPAVEENNQASGYTDAVVGGEAKNEEPNKEIFKQTQKKKSNRQGRRRHRHRKEDAPAENNMDVDSDMSISPTDTRHSKSSSERTDLLRSGSGLAAGIATPVDEGIDEIAKRYAVPYVNLDYGIQSTQSRYPSSGLVTPSFPLASTTGSSAMDRYAPRLVETNYLRPGNLAPAGSLSGGSSIYGIPAINGDLHPDSTGFAPPPRHTYPRPGSSGWVDS